MHKHTHTHARTCARARTHTHTHTHTHSTQPVTTEGDFFKYVLRCAYNYFFSSGLNHYVSTNVDIMTGASEPHAPQRWTVTCNTYDYEYQSSNLPHTNCVCVCVGWVRGGGGRLSVPHKNLQRNAPYVQVTGVPVLIKPGSSRIKSPFLQGLDKTTRGNNTRKSMGIILTAGKTRKRRGIIPAPTIATWPCKLQPSLASCFDGMKQMYIAQNSRAYFRCVCPEQPFLLPAQNWGTNLPLLCPVWIIEH